ncbi:hypothetical protein NDU88_008794 [Pleurodeles waltl]|uniref:Uncharacterized protein n=1 Tax=Pleurodeles waltl TaxID=8319 RepID=A0AAV7PQI0_PLEWA|nr:hypothetical protein NDU88_008794 [Pleurodeles waltl]
MVLSSTPRVLLWWGEEKNCGRSQQLCTAGRKSVREGLVGGRSGRGPRGFGALAAGYPLGLPQPRTGGGVPFWALRPFGCTGRLLRMMMPGLG